MSHENMNHHNNNGDNNEDDVWLGIDLGTSNCAVAVWDRRTSEAQLLSLSGGTKKKKQKLLPSTATLFQSERVVVGQESVTLLEQAWKRSISASPSSHSPSTSSLPDNDKKANISPLFHQRNNKQSQSSQRDPQFSVEELSNATISSVKRVLGMTYQEAKVQPKQFWDSLLFDTNLVVPSPNPTTANEGTTETNHSTNHGGVTISVTPCCDNHPLQSFDSKDTCRGGDEVVVVEPTQVAAWLLRALRTEAQASLKRPCRNCVVGVPAHFGVCGRRAVEEAARLAGFDGEVSTIMESTAAAMAYGLYVAPTTTSTPPTNSTTTTTTPSSSQHKILLVFDMGGGTTDVTIASMTDATTSTITTNEDDDGEHVDEARFHVMATAGDCQLGGNDMDQVLVQYVLEQAVSPHSKSNHDTIMNKGDQWELRTACRRAKEALCGGGNPMDMDDEHYDPDTPGVERTTIHWKDHAVEITQTKLEQLLGPLLERVERVVDEACQGANHNHSSSSFGETAAATAIVVQEVILVGGATRVPAVRDLLRRKFQTSVPELCTSVPPHAAVAQGAAIQAAIRSKKVPRHELRSALMLDALPHTIGILGGGSSEHSPPNNDDTTSSATLQYDNKSDMVPILNRHAPLPAMGYATFFLSTVDQKGVTVMVVEDVGTDSLLQPVGTFSFLLHKLTPNQQSKLHRDQDGVPQRSVDIGLTMETDGKLIVSIYDEHDPDHVLKRKRYLQEKTQDGTSFTPCLQHDNDTSVTTSFEDEGMPPKEQLMLMGICVILFGLYVVMRIAFNDLSFLHDEPSIANDL
eukprot:scaffold46682_cov37-Attheya_sp.AAC.3